MIFHLTLINYIGFSYYYILYPLIIDSFVIIQIRSLNLFVILTLLKFQIFKNLLISSGLDFIRFCQKIVTTNYSLLHLK